MRLAHAVRGLEVVRTHSSAHPLLRGPNPLDPQLRPDFPVALTMKRRRLKHPADVAHQDLVRGRTDGPAAMPARAASRCLPPRRDTRPRPCPHAADALHTIRPTGWRSTGRRSSRRPPAGQRAAGLQLVSLRIQQLGLHQEFADRGLQPTEVVVPCLGRSALQAGLARRQKPIAPLRGPRRRDAQLPRHRLEILTPQEAEHRRAFTPGRTPPLSVTLGGRSGRPPGSRRRRRLTLIVLPHLDTPPARTFSQSSVQENPRAMYDCTHRDLA